jgi:hypothetical protein
MSKPAPLQKPKGCGTPASFKRVPSNLRCRAEGLSTRQLIQQAWQKVDEAQQDNHYNLGGHAGRAKELLSQASEEIRLSADAANDHR